MSLFSQLPERCPTCKSQQWDYNGVRTTCAFCGWMAQPDAPQPQVESPPTNWRPLVRQCGNCGGVMAQVACTEELGSAKMTYECTGLLCPENPKSKENRAAEEPARGDGIKLDNGKPKVYTEFLMQFPRAIRLVARVGERGSQAPGHVRSGWKSVDRGHERYSNAFARHILREVMLATEAEPTSPDPMHDLIWEAATVAWNDLARLEHLIRANSAAAERIDGDPLA